MTEIDRVGQLKQDFIERKVRFEQEHPNFVRYIEHLVGTLQTNDGRARLVGGFEAMYNLSRDPLYLSFFVTSMALALERGMPIDQAKESWTAEDNPIAVTHYGQLDRIKESWGLLGFCHGHYRFLTPGSLTGLCIASEHCDFLLVGIESNERTSRYKGSETPFTNEQRLQLLGRVADGVFTIESGTSYKPGGYSELVSSVNPNIYFGNPRKPVRIRAQMQQIALNVGAQYQEIYVPSYSTTEYLTSRGFSRGASLSGRLI